MSCEGVASCEGFERGMSHGLKGLSLNSTAVLAERLILQGRQSSQLTSKMLSCLHGAALFSFYISSSFDRRVIGVSAGSVRDIKNAAIMMAHQTTHC